MMSVVAKQPITPRLEETPSTLRDLIAAAQARSRQPIEIVLNQVTFDNLYAAASEGQGFRASGWDGAQFDGISVLIRPGGPRTIEVREKPSPMPMAS